MGNLEGWKVGKLEDWKDGRLVVGRSKLVAELLLVVMLLTACAFSPEQAIIQEESHQQLNPPTHQPTNLPIYQSSIP
jgi:hypothetical protein